MPSQLFKKNIDYTDGPIGRNVYLISMPIFFELVAWNIDSILEVYWIGRLGPSALAAMTIAFITLICARAGGMGIRVPAQALVAQYIGSGDKEKAALVAGQTFLLQLLYFVPISLLGIIIAPYLVGFFSSEDPLRSLAITCLRSGFIMVIFIDGIFTIGNLLRGAGDVTLSLKGMIISSCIVFWAIPLLIYGYGYIPSLKIAGVFIGLGAGRLVGCMVMTYFLFSGRSKIPLKLYHLKPNKKQLLQIISLGWPAMGQMLFERSANVVLVSMLAPFGAIGLAAWSIGSRVNNMGRMPGFVLQSSSRTLVGQNIGAGKIERAALSARFVLCLLFFIMIFVTTGFFYWAKEIVVFFGMGNEGSETAEICFQILSLGVGFEAARRVVAGIFEGSADTKPPMIIEGIIRWGVLLPAAFLLSYTFNFKEFGIWWSVAGSQILGGVALFVWYMLAWPRKQKII